MFTDADDFADDVEVRVCVIALHVCLCQQGSKQARCTSCS
jgi:hypothetical protein